MQSLVRLLGLTPTQLNLTQANFTAVMALPTFATKPGVYSPFSTVAPVVLKSSNTTVKLTTSGFLPGDVRDPDILMYDDPTEDAAAAAAATRNSTAFPAAVAAAKGVLINATSDSNSGTAELSPLLLPLPSFDSVRFTCDAVRIAGRSASVLDAAAIARMNDSDILDCVEVFGRLDLPAAAANFAAIAAEVWRPFGGDMSANGRPVLGGNLMVMLDNLLSGLLTNSSLVSQVDFSFKTNFDGLGVLGMRFREIAPVITSYNSSNSNYNSSLSPTAALLTGQYLAANAGTGGQQQQRQLTDVEVAGLGQLLCGLDGTQWLTAISPSVAVGVREAVMATLVCTVSDEVNFANFLCFC